MRANLFELKAKRYQMMISLGSTRKFIKELGVEDFQEQISSIEDLLSRAEVLIKRHDARGTANTLETVEEALVDLELAVEDLAPIGVTI